MTESRMAVQYADITAVPEFVRQNGNIGWVRPWACQSVLGKGEKGEVGNISQEIVGTESCNRAGFPEVQDWNWHIPLQRRSGDVQTCANIW